MHFVRYEDAEAQQAVSQVLYRVSTTGGQLELLGEIPTCKEYVAISPDGTLVACGVDETETALASRLGALSNIPASWGPCLIPPNA